MKITFKLSNELHPDTERDVTADIVSRAAVQAVLCDRTDAELAAIVTVCTATRRLCRNMILGDITIAGDDGKFVTFVGSWSTYRWIFNSDDQFDVTVEQFIALLRDESTENWQESSTMDDIAKWSMFVTFIGAVK
jgi:FPC/CPF motif-containing protein YcgG